MSKVRDNIMSVRDYTPYCGAIAGCKHTPRTTFNGKQFECPHCSWTSRLPATFIANYRIKWSIG
jgi:hypothetical protein